MPWGKRPLGIAFLLALAAGLVARVAAAEPPVDAAGKEGDFHPFDVAAVPPVAGVAGNRADRRNRP